MKAIFSAILPGWTPRAELVRRGRASAWALPLPWGHRLLLAASIGGAWALCFLWFRRGPGTAAPALVARLARHPHAALRGVLASWKLLAALTDGRPC